MILFLKIPGRLFFWDPAPPPLIVDFRPACVRYCHYANAGVYSNSNQSNKIDLRIMASRSRVTNSELFTFFFRVTNSIKIN